MQSFVLFLQVVLSLLKLFGLLLQFAFQMPLLFLELGLL